MAQLIKVSHLNLMIQVTERLQLAALRFFAQSVSRVNLPDGKDICNPLAEHRFL